MATDVNACYNLVMEESQEKDKGGRPPVGPKMDVRLWPDQVEKIAAAAKAANTSRAEIIRRLIDWRWPEKEHTNENSS